MSTSVSPSYPTAASEVKARVAASRTSFHAGMMILPKARREAMYAVYAFCREVDDIADESASVTESKKGLEEWRTKIRLLFENNQASDCITKALQPAIRAFDLMEVDFQTVIDGMEMDAATVICAPPLAMLDLYCDRVASAVGRISVRVFGDASPSAMEVAYHLGRALQLTNILRDLEEDAARGRLYLPVEYLIRHSIETRIPAEVLAHPSLSRVCQDLAQRASEHFTDADRAILQCQPRPMRPAKIMRSYYGAILKKLKKDDWRHGLGRVTLPKWQKIFLIVHSVLA